MMSKYIILAILLLSFICSAYSQRLNLDDTKNISIKNLTKYNKWRNQNKRNYLNDDEQLFRQLIFLENLEKVKQHNLNADNTFEVGTNQFSDMTEEEFASRILTQSITDEEFDHIESENDVSFADTTATIAASIDWRSKGAVTPVKNQGRCGSCWSFSTTGVMEGANFIKTGKLKTFSEQQLIDCAITANGFYAYGCSGGTANTGLNYAKKFGSLESASYPYVQSQGTCKVKTATTGFYPSTIQRLANTVDALKAALNKGPVSVSLDATLLNSYSKGLFNSCPTKLNLNHAVLAVGYDVQGNWIVKNTWGTSWGESGYVRVAAGNTCGILNYAFAVSA